MYDVELKRKWDRANILAYAREQGREQGKTEVVSSLLQTGRFTVEEIAQYANVPVSFVLEVQEKLSKTKK
ncbi:MAG: hypothetical protein ABFD10_22020 [Prolixibacteraceae bacterium]